jgi:methionyl aminopeptidase
LRRKPPAVSNVPPTALTVRREDEVMDDDWTVLTLDRSLSAQFEHTVLVTDDGVEVLTGGPGAVSPSAPWNR